jgi:hypothetical protein
MSPLLISHCVSIVLLDLNFVLCLANINLLCDLVLLDKINQHKMHRFYFKRMRFSAAGLFLTSVAFLYWNEMNNQQLIFNQPKPLNQQSEEVTGKIAANVNMVSLKIYSSSKRNS